MFAGRDALHRADGALREPFDRDRARDDGPEPGTDHGKTACADYFWREARDGSNAGSSGPLRLRPFRRHHAATESRRFKDDVAKTGGVQIIRNFRLRIATP